MNTPGGNHLGSVKPNPINQHHQINIASSSHNLLSQSVSLNLPCRDLFNRREDFNAICLPLYNALTTGDFEAAKVIIDKRPELVRFSITESYETTLHIAVLEKAYRFVQYLMSLMTTNDLELRNENGETAFSLVARTGNVQIAKVLVEKNRGLIDIPDSQERFPLQVAVLFGRRHMVEYLYNNSSKMSGVFWTDKDRSWVFEKCVEANLFDVALRMVIDLPELAINGSVLRLLARRREPFLVARPFHFVARFLLSVLGVKIEYVGDECKTLELLKIMMTEIMKLSKAEIDDIIRGPPDEITEEDAKIKYSSRLLFLAVELGSIAFILEVIRHCPHLAREVNDNNQSIFHIAVSQRYKDIYKLLYKKNHVRDLIVTLEDKNGNNMLHLVGESAKSNRLPSISVMGRRSSQELIWFKEVKKILPSHLHEKRNASGLTPYELFINNHKDLFSKEEKLMKEMATQLMVVAALVATISFAALYTFPGGYKQDTGIPIFLQKTLSKIFLIFDSLSFLSSTTSILIVISIIMTDHNAYDFMISLARQIKVCLLLVFFSIATIIVTFLISLFLLYESNSNWIPVLISAFAVMPYMAFMSIQNGLQRFL